MSGNHQFMMNRRDKSFKNLQVRDLDVSENLVVCGNILLKGNVTVNEDLTVCGDTKIKGDLEVDGCITDKCSSVKISQADLPYVISAPGVYVLCGDLLYAPIAANTVAITIQANTNNVTLDLCSHTLSLTSSQIRTRGIKVDRGVNNVLIQNGTVRDFNTQGSNGIEVRGITQNVELRDLLVTNNGAKTPTSSILQGGMLLGEWDSTVAVPPFPTTIDNDGNKNNKIVGLALHNVRTKDNGVFGCTVQGIVNMLIEDSEFGETTNLSTTIGECFNFHAGVIDSRLLNAIDNLNIKNSSFNNAFSSGRSVNGLGFGNVSNGLISGCSSTGNTFQGSLTQLTIGNPALLPSVGPAAYITIDLPGPVKHYFWVASGTAVDPTVIGAIEHSVLYNPVAATLATNFTTAINLVLGFTATSSSNVVTIRQSEFSAPKAASFNSTPNQLVVAALARQAYGTVLILCNNIVFENCNFGGNRVYGGSACNGFHMSGTGINTQSSYDIVLRDCNSNGNRSYSPIAGNLLSGVTGFVLAFVRAVSFERCSATDNEVVGGSGFTYSIFGFSVGENIPVFQNEADNAVFKECVSLRNQVVGLPEVTQLTVGDPLQLPSVGPAAYITLALPGPVIYYFWVAKPGAVDPLVPGAIGRSVVYNADPVTLAANFETAIDLVRGFSAVDIANVVTIRQKHDFAGAVPDATSSSAQLVVTVLVQGQNAATFSPYSGGFVFGCGNNQVRDCVSSFNTGGGVTVGSYAPPFTGLADKNVIDNCSCVNNIGSGIFIGAEDKVQTRTVTVTNNKCSYNSVDGIRIASAPVVTVLTVVDPALLPSGPNPAAYITLNLPGPVTHYFWVNKLGATDPLFPAPNGYSVTYNASADTLATNFRTAINLVLGFTATSGSNVVTIGQIGNAPNATSSNAQLVVVVVLNAGRATVLDNLVSENGVFGINDINVNASVSWYARNTAVNNAGGNYSITYAGAVPPPIVVGTRTVAAVVNGTENISLTV